MGSNPSSATVTMGEPSRGVTDFDGTHPKILLSSDIAGSFNGKDASFILWRCRFDFCPCYKGCNPIMIDPHFFEMRKAGYTSDSFKNTAMCLIGGMIHMIGIQKTISEETPPERVGAN